MVQQNLAGKAVGGGLYGEYPKAVWNFMMREQQMKVRKLCEQQGIMPSAKQTSADARFSALEAKFEISSHPEEGDVKKTEGQPLEEQGWVRNRGNPVVTHQAYQVVSMRNLADS